MKNIRKRKGFKAYYSIASCEYMSRKKEEVMTNLGSVLDGNTRNVLSETLRRIKSKSADFIANNGNVDQFLVNLIEIRNDLKGTNSVLKKIDYVSKRIIGQEEKPEASENTIQKDETLDSDANEDTYRKPEMKRFISNKISSSWI